MNRLEQTLKSFLEIKDYKITKTHKHSYELFYVATKIETARSTDSESTNVTIYVDENGMRGNADFKYADYLSDDELKSNIEDAIFNAKLALNPKYELPASQDKPAELVSNLADKPFSEIAKEVAEAVFSNEMNDVIYSAATEIFLYKLDISITNSKGLSNNETRYYGEIELIPSYDTKDKEVEVYHMARFANFDKAAIANEVKENLELVKDRFNAIDLPEEAKSANIIIDGYEVKQVFDYFAQDLNYASKFTKGNLYELDEEIASNDITMSLVPYSLGASDSCGFDGDGITLKDITIIDKGVAKSRHGNNQFGFYLGVKPTGSYKVTKVEAGKTSFNDMKAKPYIRCVRFSSMQMEHTSGLVGGEVRLGYYFDGTKEIPVTGFTFTGNLHSLRKSMVISKETKTYSNYFGPQYLLFPEVKII